LDELRGFDPWSRVPPERRKEVVAHFERLKQGDAPQPMEHRVSRPDGQELILESSLSVASMDGAPAVISDTRDITQRMHLQAELVKQDRRGSVGLLGAGVAHELNNPLTSVALQARRLRDDADKHEFSEEVRTALAEIDDGARRMTAIIADLLFM